MSEPTQPTSAAPGYYQRHIFFCLNERTNGEDSCAHHNAQAGFDHCKAQVNAAGLAGTARAAGARVAIVNPHPSEIDDEAHWVLRGTAATLLPALLDTLA